MFWIFLLVISSAVVLAKLGAYSVWFTVLTGALQVVLGIGIVVGAWFLWRYLANRRNETTTAPAPVGTARRVRRRAT